MKQSGFTLLELLISMVITMIVVMTLMLMSGSLIETTITTGESKREQSAQRYIERLLRSDVSGVISADYFECKKANDWFQLTLLHTSSEYTDEGDLVLTRWHVKFVNEAGSLSPKLFRTSIGMAEWHAMAADRSALDQRLNAIENHEAVIENIINFMVVGMVYDAVKGEAVEWDPALSEMPEFLHISCQWISPRIAARYTSIEQWRQVISEQGASTDLHQFNLNFPLRRL